MLAHGQTGSWVVLAPWASWLPFTVRQKAALALRVSAAKADGARGLCWADRLIRETVRGGVQV